MLSSVVSTIDALRAAPALVGRIRMLEDQVAETATRVISLERDLDDVEALAREINVKPRAAT
jgi:hypothetical protein